MYKRKAIDTTQVREGFCSAALSNGSRVNRRGLPGLFLNLRQDTNQKSFDTVEHVTGNRMLRKAG